MNRKTWALSFELATIESATRAITLLLERIDDTHDDRETRDIAHAVHAIATLADLRLREIGRMLRGELDPAVLHGPHNAIDPDAEVDDLDVIFGAAQPIPKHR